jgi:hypothetical protein
MMTPSISPIRYAMPWRIVTQKPMQNLGELTRKLIEARVEFVLVGGFAAAAYGVTLLTRDVDICCSFDLANLMCLQQALAGLHPVHRSRPDLPLELTPDECSRLKNLHLRTDLGPLDCLGEVLGIGGFDEVMAHSTELELPFGSCRILDLETLIRAKEAMNRDHDRISVRQLNEILKRRQTP